MPQEFLKTVKEIISKKDRLVVAVSGGSDSVGLLQLLLEHGYHNLIVAHFNHKLRGKAADLDEKFVRKMARESGLIFECAGAEIKSLSIKQKTSLEETARNERYAFLARIRRKHNAKMILLAHTQDDQIETILWNLVRGCSLKGLGGMRQLNHYLFRPLLNVRKSEILTYLKQRHQKYRIDRSNQELFCTRNILRHKVIPLLTGLNPNLNATMLRNLANVREADDFLQQSAKNWLSANLKNNSFVRSRFMHLANIMRKYVLLALYQQYYGNLTNVSHDFIHEILKLIMVGKTGKQKKFGSDMTVRINYAKVDFVDQSLEFKINAITKLKIPGITSLKNSRTIEAKIVKTFQPQKNICSLDYEKIENGRELYLRSWKYGDRMKPLGLKGTKKLQDLFGDMKIPREKRMNIPVIVTKKGQIVCVLPYQIADQYKITKSSHKILKLKLT